MLEIGSLVDGKYKILNIIGKGGMSTVYLAMNERANKQWAIKEIRKDGVQNYEVVKQGMIMETNLLKQLKHPNLPSIVDVIDDDDIFLIVMDYIEGVPLSRLLEEGRQPQEKVVDWAIQLCSVLQYLHTRETPIIYRDMKPSNVMLKPDGTVMLIDFGTARTFKRKNVEDTTCLGTVGYAAPEQFGGRGQTDERTDIYCLGATLYHLVTGQNPSEPPYEMYPITYWDPLLSTGLESIILQCTKQSPKERFQNCEELMFALKHYKELDVEYKRRQNKKFAIFAGSAVAALIFAGMTIWADFQYKKTVTSNYEYYMQRAQSEVQKEDMIAQYKNAIHLDPAKGEAYERLLEEVILNDDILSEEEAYAIRDILNDTADGNRRNEESFMQNPVEYERFAYELGIAYFYTYEDKGNKTLAKKWLEIAANSQNLEENQVERAKCLGRIAAYYSKIGVESKSGDSSISYLDYWKDLIQLTGGDLAQKDNLTTAMVVYKEFVYQIYTNCIHFKEEGIEKKEMEDQLTAIRKQVASDVKAVNLEENERIRVLNEELTQYLELAEDALDAAFAINSNEKEALP
ncbi:MAG: serine/threonine protein kinase [Roseburia sp.]|nr:serine/threonine protein kinase [Roseburia sp.]MCM1278641.1 serine/threonine protein kinase [Robinsoniella sp.]